MRTSLDCPFSPHADVVPPIWAGRTSQLSDWRDIVRPRRLAGLPERGRTILGEAGLGKSTLVRRIAQDASAQGDWVTPQLRIPSKADPLKIVAAAMLKLAHTAGLASSTEKRIRDLIERVESVAVSGFALSVRRAEGPEPFTALTELLVEIAEAALRREDVVVLIHIDEVQNIADEHVLSQLLIALGDAMAHEIEVDAPGGLRVTRHLPLAVYLTGLPDFADMAATRRGATFARRFKTTTLEPLGDNDLEEALQPFVLEGWEVPNETGGTDLVGMQPEARAAILELCCGEPFLFQLAGEQAWYAGSSEVITREQVLRGWEMARGEATAHVERILDRLPRREREFLDVMAGLDAADRTLTTIAQGMNLSGPTAAGPTSQRLDTIRGIIRRGKLYTFRHRAVEAYLTSDWPDVAV